MKPNREIIVGRSSEYDMVLDEERVSRCHARIFTFNGEVVLKDQGSTNGTFVNGERVDEAILKPGDRILIGSSVMECVTVQADDGPKMVTTPPPVEDGERTVNATVSMSQLLRGCFPEDGKLVEILTFWTQARRGGVLHVESEAGDFADLYFDGGALAGVRLKMADGDGYCSGARKSLFRVVSWSGGVFSFESKSDDHEGRCDLDGDTEALLALSIDERDELRGLAPHLPARTVRFRSENPLVPSLSELSAEALDTFQAVYNLGVVGAVLDASEATDLETGTDLLYLLQNGYITNA